MQEDAKYMKFIIGNIEAGVHTNKWKKTYICTFVSTYQTNKWKLPKRQEFKKKKCLVNFTEIKLDFEQSKMYNYNKLFYDCAHSTSYIISAGNDYDNEQKYYEKGEEQNTHWRKLHATDVRTCNNN